MSALLYEARQMHANVLIHTLFWLGYPLHYDALSRYILICPGSNKQLTISLDAAETVETETLVSWVKEQMK